MRGRYPQKLIDGDWHNIQWQDIKKGDYIRVWEKHGKLVMDYMGRTEWITTSDGFYSERYNDWYVNKEGLEDIK